MDVVDRAARLRSRLTEVACDALLVTNLTNVRYLSGFTGSAALLLVPADEAAELVFVTDGRYRDQAASQLADAGVAARTVIAMEEDGRRRALAGAAVGLGRLGLEAENVTWAQKRRFAADWFPDAQLVPTVGLVESLRLVKDAGEVARIQAACEMADAALAAVRHRLGEGPTEAEVALELEWQMRRLGAGGRRSRPSSPPAPTAPCRIIGRPTAASQTATSWSSTSGRWSTATTPT
jgi:Xaa-Pro aminopeptidase